MGTPPDTQHDVIVVGLGPVGAVAAILLAQRGHDVAVLERHDTPYGRPRAVHFDGEVARQLAACEIGGQLPAITSSSGTYEWRNATGQTLLRFPPTPDDGSGWPAGNMFCQAELEAVLEARCRELPSLGVRRGVDVTGIEQDGDGVVVHHRGGTVRGRYAIGCDGANSLVRESLGIPVTDLGFFYDWLICDVKLHEPRAYDPENLQVCDPARPTTVVSGGPGRRRWEFMRLPDEPVDALNEASAAWALLAPWDVTPANAELERHTVYRFEARWVDEWRKGRVLLAGDAAHLMPPFAGQGMCAGVRDATSAAWRLDLVLRGLAGEALLDSHGAERQPHVRSVIELSIELGKVICVPDPVAAAARDEAMVAGVAAAGGASQMPPHPVVTVGAFARSLRPGTGDRVVQGHVRDGDDRAGRFDDVFGTGWVLIVAEGTTTSLGADQRTWFASIGGRVVHLGPAGDAEDVSGAYSRWFADHSATAVLQRPDFRAFGTVPIGAGAAATDDLLDELRAVLGG